jgi:hypothetical protein
VIVLREAGRSDGHISIDGLYCVAAIDGWLGFSLQPQAPRSFEEDEPLRPCRADIGILPGLPALHDHDSTRLVSVLADPTVRHLVRCGPDLLQAQALIRLDSHSGPMTGPSSR